MKEDGSCRGGTLSNTVSDPLAQAGTSIAYQPPTPADELVTGSRIDRYIVLDLQGRGGMGVVYSAYDPRLDRKIALKLLSDGDASGPRRERLLREAKALAQLAHPNVVAVFDVGSFGEHLFLAMELVAGQTLRAWLQPRRPWRDVVRVFIEAGRGLAAAHAAGVIHRDFKPENILIGTDGRARVVDFGVARSVADAAASGATGAELAASLTASGQAVGTPAYMSPEQKAGQLVDARSDQFSFCVALFEALHGWRPTDGPSRTVEARAPSYARRVIERGLSAVPAERYPTMDALLAELAHDPTATRWRLGVLGIVILATVFAVVVLRGQEQPARYCRDGQSKLAGVWDDASKRAGRSAFLATGKPFATTAWSSVEHALDRAGDTWVAEWTEACEATRVRGEQSEELLDLRMNCLEGQRQDLGAFVRLLASADDQVVQHVPLVASSTIDVDRCRRTEALRQIVKPPGDSATRARVHVLREQLADASALRSAGKYAEAVVAAGTVLTAAREVAYLPMMADAQFLLALSQDIKGERKMAVVGLVEAAALAETAQDDHVRAKSLAELVRVLGRLERYDEADGYTRLAEAAIQRVGTPDDLRIRLLRARARVRQGRGRYDEMVELCKEIVALRERSAEAQPALFAEALRYLGDAYRLQGNKDRSLEVSKRALVIVERALGGDHPSTATAINSVAAAYSEMYRSAEALPYFERALRIREVVFGRDHVDVAVSAENLGLALADLGQFDRARALLERSLAIKAKALGPSQSVAMTWWSLAKMQLQRGDAADARVSSRRALAMYEEKLGPEHPDVAGTLQLVAEAELALGHAAAALAASERALTIFQRTPTMRLELAQTRFTVARALAANRRDLRRARELAIAARDVFAAEGAPLRKDLLEAETWLRDRGGAAR